MMEQTPGRHLIALTFAVALAACQHAPPIAEFGSTRSSLVVPAEAPPGMTSVDVEWGRVEVPGVGVVLVAVARPAGPGPFASVIVLHGTHGFARDYVQLAQDLSKTGVLAVPHVGLRLARARASALCLP